MKVDLSAVRWIVQAAVIEVVATRLGGSPYIECIRGTRYDDTLIGNRAHIVLEGRQGRDVVVGGRARDSCIVFRREDALRNCERVRSRDSDR